MLLTNREYMGPLRSPEGDEGAGGAGSGQPAPKGDTVPRTELDEAIKRRDNATARARELEAKNHELAEKLAKFEQGGGEQRKPAEPPNKKPKDDGGDDPLKLLLTRLDSLESKIDGKTRAEAKDRTVGAILGQLPEGQRSAARLMLRGLEADGSVNLEAPTAVADAIAKLTEHQPSLFTDSSRGVQKFAPQRKPDGNIDSSRYQTIEQVPKEYLGQLSDDEFDRLTGAASGGVGRKHGYNI